jgi:hypothetical protein
MRRLALVLGCVALLLGTGCTPPWSKVVVTPPNQGRMISETPTAAQLVGQLNDTSQRIQTLECRDVWIEAKQGRQDVSLPGSMICRKNRDFRLMAKMVGQPAVDIGSNDREFWFWISKAEPPGLYFCSYADLAQGRVSRLPFPFQPSWVMEALGMADRDPNGVFEPIKTTANTFELAEKTTGPLGQPVRKVTIFSRTQGMVVLGHRLEDAAGHEICTAQITERTYDQANRVIVPKRVTLVWPAQQLTMGLKLEGTRINGAIEADRAQAAFNRPQMRNIPSYDLARFSDQPSGQVQRTGGIMR